MNSGYDYKQVAHTRLSTRQHASILFMAKSFSIDAAKAAVQRDMKMDTSRMKLEPFVWAGIIVLAATGAAHLWIIQGISDNGSIYYVDHEVYSYIFDTLSFSFKMPSRLVGGVIGIVAAVLWLVGLMTGMMTTTPGSPGGRSSAWFIFFFRFIFWMANVSVMLSLGPLTGTNDFFQLLMIGFTEAACTHSLLNIHRKLVKKQTDEEQRKLVGDGNAGGQQTVTGEGWLTFMIIFVAWVVPHVVIGFNMFAIFDGKHGGVAGSATSISSVDKTSTVALFCVWTSVVFMAKIYLVKSVYDGDGWISMATADELETFGSKTDNAWAKEVMNLGDKELDDIGEELKAKNKTHIGKANTAHFFMSFALFLYALIAASIISASNNKSGKGFYGLIQLNWHTGSAKTRVGSVMTENFNFVSHSYVVSALWMMAFAALSMVIVYIGPTFSRARLKNIINKAQQSRPDLLSYAFVGFAAGLMNSYALVASGFNDPVTLIATTALTTAGFALVSRVRVNLTGSTFFWLLAMIIASLPVVVVAESVFMTQWGTKHFGAKWDTLPFGTDREVFSILHFSLSALETFFTVLTTCPFIPAFKRDPFMRWWFFFAVQCSVMLRMFYTTIHGQSAIFTA